MLVKCHQESQYSHVIMSSYTVVDIVTVMVEPQNTLVALWTVSAGCVPEIVEQLQRDTYNAIPITRYP